MNKNPDFPVGSAPETLLREAPPLAFAEAAMLHRAGRLADAEQICRRIVAAEPAHADSHHLLGIILHQRGDYAGAVRHMELAHAVNPGNFVVLNNCGNALHALKRSDEALACYDRALALRPDYAEAHYNRGNVLGGLKRFDEAVASFDRALSLRPAYAEAFCNRGVVLYALRRFEEALASYDRALALRPDYIEALCNRGNALAALKRFGEALASCDRALAMQPDFAEALCNRGVALHALERFDEALASYDHAIALRPNHAEAVCKRGATLQALERFDEALASYDRALALRPDYIEALSNRAPALHALQRFDEALASCDRALAVQPGFAEAHCHRGNALHALKRSNEALASFDRALAARPDYAEVLHNRSVALYGLKRFDEALVDSAGTLAIRPDFAEVHFNEACCRLATADLLRGWQKYEWRWQTGEQKRHRRNFIQPLWLGSGEIAGQTILLHAEQGFGDTIQFCRYVPRVVERGARVILEVQEPLQGLMRSLPGAAQIVSPDDPLPDFNRHCPLLSLPLAFATTLETIPAATPYLNAPPRAAMDWSARLGPRTRPRIGLAWSGRPNQKNGHRSIGLGALSPLFDLNATYVSLQPGVRDADAAMLHGFGNLIHFGHELKDFTDTAALISNLDLVVSVDTAVAHLAGALARPVWILLPYIADWRWLVDRDDSPWYPTARLFRQDETQEWDGAVARIRAALQTAFAV
jgi:tetratricopeptide (TPR) repeat protein